MASAAEKAQGIVSLDYQLKGRLNADMMPVYPSLVGGGTLSVKDVKVRGLKMFNAVSKETSSEAMKNPDVSKVDIKTKIKNNIMTVERFKFKFAGFRPRIEGTTSLDGKLNLKMRLGLPPLGIFGIPLTVTGTQDKPKVKVGRNTENLEETKDTEE
jgi:AsmA protein